MAVRVCLGGTFDRLHVGHERLLAKAFEVGDEVFIGLTSQAMAQRHRRRRVRPFARRKRDLEALLRRHRWKGVVAEIIHPFGRSTERAYDAIVVSPETLSRTVAINRVRRRRGYKPLHVFTIPYAHAADGIRLTATRVAAGEIDARGRRRTPLRIAVGTHNALKAAAVADAFRAAFPSLRPRAVPVRVRSGVPEQPRNAQTHAGAAARARRALAAKKDYDYGVGVEAGLVWNSSLRKWTDVQYVVVLDKLGQQTEAHGGGFYYPDAVTRQVLRGRTISDVMGPLAGDHRLGSTTGAIGFLTRGALDRRALTTHAVLLALAPRIRPQLYEEAAA